MSNKHTTNNILYSNLHTKPLEQTYCQQLMFIPNNICFKGLRSYVINNSGADLEKIYDIDKEAFKDLETYDTFEEYKEDVIEADLTTYIVKDTEEPDKIIGYYQLEPPEDNKMYISSIALKPEYRNTKKGYEFLKHSWEEINNYAQKNDIKTLSLHVDSKNEPLIKMYKKVGFNIKACEKDYYENGNSAYFMQAKVLSPKNSGIKIFLNKNINNTKLPKKIDAKEITRSKMEEASEYLISKGVSAKYVRNDIINLATVKDANNNPEFCEEIFNAGVSLMEKYTPAEAKDILSLVVEKDINGNKIFRTDALEAIEKLGFNFNNSRALLLAARNFDTDENPKENHKAKINMDFINGVKYLLDNNKNISKPVELVQVSHKFVGGKKIVDYDALNFALSNPDENMRFYIPLMYEGDSDNNFFVPEKYYSDFSKRFSKGGKKILNSGKRLIAKNGGNLKEYIHHYDEINKLVIPIAEIKTYEEKLNPHVFITNACVDNMKTSDNNVKKFWNSEIYSLFEKHAVDKYKKSNDKLDEKVVFRSFLHLTNTINACKIKGKENDYVCFDKKIFDKALELNKISFDNEIISKALNVSIYNKKEVDGTVSQFFNQDVFNKIIEMKKNKMSEDVIVNIMLASKDKVAGSDVFNEDTFNKLCNNQKICQYFPDNLIPAFKEVYDKENSAFNYNILVLNQEHLPISQNTDYFFETKKEDDKIIKYIFQPEVAKAYNELLDYTQNIVYIDRPENISIGPIRSIFINFCTDFRKEENIKYTKFNQLGFDYVKKMLDNGESLPNVVNIVNNLCYKDDNAKFVDPKRIALHQKILKENKNVSPLEAAIVVNAGIDKDNKIDYEKTDNLIELTKLGMPPRALVSAIDLIYKNGELDELMMKRCIQSLDNGLTPDIIKNCSENGAFKDRLFKQAGKLSGRGFSAEQVYQLMGLCQEDKSDYNKQFNQNIYNHILELDSFIDKDMIPDFLKACFETVNSKQKFSEKAYSKIFEMKKMDYDTSFIELILKSAKTEVNLGTELFDENLYKEFIQISKDHKQLRDAQNNDASVLTKLINNKFEVNQARKEYGKDVIDYAVSSKIDNYINFCKRAHAMSIRGSDEFNIALKQKLDILHSPELKVKKINIIGGLFEAIGEDDVKKIVNEITSLTMTDKQLDIANDIFTLNSDDVQAVKQYLDRVNVQSFDREFLNKSIKDGKLNNFAKDVLYKVQVDDFIETMEVPSKNRDIMRKYLLEENLHKQVIRPKPIEEQLRLMDYFVQQMKLNPSIPSDKKEKYLEEYNSKKLDMQQNPNKYTKPSLNIKPINGLKKMVEAYINIPKDEEKFNKLTLQAMYKKYGIKFDEYLLSSIQYDSKYFNKIMVAHNGFGQKFKQLISFVQLNPDKKLSQIRNEIPKEINKLEQYKDLGLLGYVEANLETKKQFENYNLNYDKWNEFDPNLKGESFSVLTDTKGELQNIKTAIHEEVYKNLCSKLNKTEAKKLNEEIVKKGFEIDNIKNEIVDVERYADFLLNYPFDFTRIKGLAEKEAISMFKDHIQGHKKKISDLRNARDVENVYFRLTDDNNIGRNIFFGNHVGCCNSVESTYGGYAAPLHLINSYVRGLEIVDKNEHSYGNSLCFFADVDGHLAFVIDSFEANGKLASNPIVTEKMLKFAKTICKEMGREDAKIMLGPNYNNIDIQSFFNKTNEHVIKVLGSSPTNSYCDSLGGTADINQITPKRSMYEIKGKEVSPITYLRNHLHENLQTVLA